MWSRDIVLCQFISYAVGLTSLDFKPCKDGTQVRKTTYNFVVAP